METVIRTFHNGTQAMQEVITGDGTRVIVRPVAPSPFAGVSLAPRSPSPVDRSRPSPVAPSITYAITDDRTGDVLGEVTTARGYHFARCMADTLRYPRNVLVSPVA